MQRESWFVCVGDQVGWAADEEYHGVEECVLPRVCQQPHRHRHRSRHRPGRQSRWVLYVRAVLHTSFMVSTSLA